MRFADALELEMKARGGGRRLRVRSSKLKSKLLVRRNNMSSRGPEKGWHIAHASDGSPTNGNQYEKFGSQRSAMAAVLRRGGKVVRG